MALTRLKSYEKLLSEFEAEVRSDPDADFAPAIRKLAAKLARMEKRREKQVINTLFLTLYGEEDAASLRRDLCGLEIPDTAEDPSAQRSKLLWYLYGALSRYIKEIVDAEWHEHHDAVCSNVSLTCMNISDLKREYPGKICICCPYGRDSESGLKSWMFLLAVDCVGAANVALEFFGMYPKNGRENAVAISTTEPIAIAAPADREYYETVLSSFREEVRRNPEDDVTPSADELAAAFSVREKGRGRNVIITLLLNLYGQDIDSLKRDWGKAAFLYNKEKPPKATSSQRTELLPYLYGALSGYLKEDLSNIIAMCDHFKPLETEQ